MINLHVYLQPAVFFFFSGMLLLSGFMVIISRNPVRGVLFLVLAFFASAVLWMLMEAEFLSLVLIFVYVGAVMTLFLFVVMMLNINEVPAREKFVRYFPIGLLIMVALVGLMLWVIGPEHFGATQTPAKAAADYSNVKALGSVLYTQYLYPFEIAAALLLVAIVSAISLAFRGPQNRRSQKIAEQLAVSKEDRLHIVNMKSETSEKSGGQ